MQIFGTRFHLTLGNLQLRLGVSLEHESDDGSCSADDDRLCVAPGAPTVGNERAGAWS